MNLVLSDWEVNETWWHFPNVQSGYMPTERKRLAIAQKLTKRIFQKYSHCDSHKKLPSHLFTILT